MIYLPRHPAPPLGDCVESMFHVKEYRPEHAIERVVPERLLTIQAELGKNFPEVLKKREKQMYNIFTFEARGAGKTSLVSYGTGYRDTPALAA